jgi:hypothetical protein
MLFTREWCCWVIHQRPAERKATLSTTTGAAQPRPQAAAVLTKAVARAAAKLEQIPGSELAGVLHMAYGAASSSATNARQIRVAPLIPANRAADRAACTGRLSGKPGKSKPGRTPDARKPRLSRGQVLRETACPLRIPGSPRPPFPSYKLTEKLVLPAQALEEKKDSARLPPRVLSPWELALTR